MIVYLLKTVCLSAIFLLVYYLFLQREKMHRFNRFYLLASVAVALVIPFIQLPVREDVLPVLPETLPGLLPEFSEETTIIPEQADLQQTAITSFTIPSLYTLYGVVVAILLVRFGMSIRKLLSIKRATQVFYRHGIRFAILESAAGSYTFLNTIFLGPKDFAEMPPEVVMHEMTHVREKHSVDILFIELVRIVFWFNPLFVLYKRAIQLNHEFLADEAAVQTCESIPAYQHMLLDRISLGSGLPLGSAFNYSITKKRLHMMTQRANYKRAMVKQFALAPVFLTCVALFGTRVALSETHPAPELPSHEVIQKKQQQPDTSNKKKERYPLGMLQNVPFDKEGLSVEEMEEYLSVQRKYFPDAPLSREKMGALGTVTDKEKQRLQSLFFRMNREQQQSVKIVFWKRLPPSKPQRPTQAQLDRWKNPALYGVWIDEKKIENEELANYSPEDFGHYFASNLVYTEKAKRNVMQKYNLKVMYKVQVNVMTKNAYDSYYRNSVQQMKDNPYNMAVVWTAGKTIQK